MQYDPEVSEHIDIVIPVYEATATIRELLERIESVVHEFQLNARVILVDDGSRDDSWAIIRNWMSTSNLKTTAIKLYKNYGQHPATMAGLKYATGDFVIIMDCDLQDQPEAIPLLVRELKARDCDLVVVRSHVRRSLLVNTTSRIFHSLTGAPKDVTTFRIARKELIASLLKMPEANKLSSPVLLEISRKTEFIEYQRENPRYGSRYTFSARFRIGMNFILSRSAPITTVFFILGIAVSCIATIYMVSILYQVFANAHPLPSGLNQIVVLLSFLIIVCAFGFGFTMLLLKEILGYVKGNPSYEISLVEHSKI